MSDEVPTTEKLIETLTASQTANAGGADAGWIMTAGVLIFFM